MQKAINEEMVRKKGVVLFYEKKDVIKGMKKTSKNRKQFEVKQLQMEAKNLNDGFI